MFLGWPIQWNTFNTVSLKGRHTAYLLYSFHFFAVHYRYLPFVFTGYLPLIRLCCNGIKGILVVVLIMGHTYNRYIIIFYTYSTRFHNPIQQYVVSLALLQPKSIIIFSFSIIQCMNILFSFSLLTVVQSYNKSCLLGRQICELLTARSPSRDKGIPRVLFVQAGSWGSGDVPPPPTVGPSWIRSSTYGKCLSWSFVVSPNPLITSRPYNCLRLG